ncbi:uncharacterized protein LOC119677539 [Teleopsis dalmanni]|uniref:uncharacterized protein LOC119677511 n=1 Tax=Teleopsis dalmanni TaxID=139649 RepID=UPI0018CD9938|nr:uncharacterized protein LOC119677511 [Teleopsis dalmanni]XP_037944846.1 uncharacterized protein LOC119677539 [Teleopsis dalmanni]
MDNYKVINKELIDQIREMRNEIAIYKQEIVEHKAEIMEQHRLRIEQKKAFIALITQSFRTVLNDIDPELNIQNLLSNTVNNSEENNLDSKNINQRSRNSRSSKVFIDFRRRSSNLQQRPSSVKMSPTCKRSVESVVEQNETSLESDDIQSISDSSVYISKENDLEENEESLEQTAQSLRLNKIVEEDTLEEVTLKTVVPVHEKQVIYTAKKQGLRDITNVDKSTASPLEINHRGKNHTSYEESIEAARFANEIERISIDNNTINTINFAISDLSIETFFQAPCSTPTLTVKEKNFYNLRDKTVIIPENNNSLKENQGSNDTLTSSTSSNSNSRPQRNRTKKNYKELRLNVKMRSDSTETKAQKKKSGKNKK